MKKLPRTVILIIAVIIVALLVAGGSLLWRYVALQIDANNTGDKRATQRVVVSNVCTDDIVSRVSPALAENDISATRAVAEEVLKQDNYVGDVNCSYILTRFYLMTGQNDKAGEALNAMEAARAAGSEYSLTFNPPVMPVAELRSALDVARANAAQDAKNEQGTEDLNDMDEAWQSKQ